MAKVPPSPTEEIRAIRRELAARFGNDIHRIAEETRRRERESGRKYISLPLRKPLPSATAKPLDADPQSRTV
jgi:hypothetical protein